MTPWLDDGDVRLYHGDALQVLAELEDGSVDCVVTSPPYWGLRDYGNEGQLGLEETPDKFVQAMVAVFREVRRVLAAHGTCWVNLGDSYASSPPGNVAGVGATSGLHGANDASGVYRETLKAGHATKRNTVVAGLKPKDLVGIPWRVAFALQTDGWYLRSDIVWAKPNPMPESVTDRPTKSHEYVFLLTKQPRYFFDQEAVREPWETTHAPGSRVNETQHYGAGNGGNSGLTAHLADVKARLRKPAQDETLDDSEGEAPRGPDGRRNTHVQASDGSIQHRDGERWPNAGRNIRSVWQIATQPYPEAHFATFPEELARRCVLAGCPVRVCRECGKPSERLTSTEYDNPGNRRTNGPRSVENLEKATHGTVNSRGSRLEKRVTTEGFTDCGHNNWRPGQVLDPFIGSGTVAKVARDHGRHAVGIDLNESYLELAARRLQQLSLLTQP